MPSPGGRVPKPRPINALYADARCFVAEDGSRQIYVEVNQKMLTAKQAGRLAEWLEAATAWKEDE